MDRKAEPQTAGEAIDAGRIEFVMHGERLKGKFALIRMKPRGKGKPQWLLMKLKDEFAEAGSKEAPKPAAKSRAVKEARSAQARRTTRAPRSVELTHPDRIIYPDAGLTKQDVFTSTLAKMTGKTWRSPHMIDGLLQESSHQGGDPHAIATGDGSPLGN